MSLFIFLQCDPAQSFVSPFVCSCWQWLSEQTKIFLLAAGIKNIKINKRHWNSHYSIDKVYVYSFCSLR